jgi:hypothetical protein
MSAFVLDAGALIAIDRNDRATVARLAAAKRHGMELRTNAMVVSQVWRHPDGRQAHLGQLLRATQQGGRVRFTVRPARPHLGSEGAGELTARPPAEGVAGAPAAR